MSSRSTTSRTTRTRRWPQTSRIVALISALALLGLSACAVSSSSSSSGAPTAITMTGTTAGTTTRAIPTHRATTVRGTPTTGTRRPTATPTRIVRRPTPTSTIPVFQITATPTPKPTHWEQEGHYGVNTFTNYHNASGMGVRISAAAWVEVSCKVYDPTITSVVPDGYWYRIASSPWDNGYYSPANTFMNGDPWNGPYTHNTDWNVPNC